MKKRVLKPRIENMLIAITLLLFMFLGCIDDFDFRAFFCIILPMIIIVVINFYILRHYGSGKFVERSQKIN